MQPLTQPSAYQPSSSLFSQSYGEARAKFLDAATEAGARPLSFRNPHAAGPAGEPLFLDAVWFGPTDAPTVLVNTSGTHGAEGYAGSAAQLAWMKDGGHRALPAGVAVLLVHAVNPFGFAWGLRGTENNVDLNRNFIDFQQSAPENALYAQLHELLCPSVLDKASLNRLMREGGRLIAKHGQWALEDAISRGQYTHPDGYHFGGAAPEWSNLTLRRLFGETLSSAKRIGLIDWHSGPTGDGELIHLCFSEPGEQSFNRLAQWWGQETLDPDQVNEKWGSKRPTRRGILLWGLQQMVGPETEVIGGVIEFRSAQPKSDATQALRTTMLERWLRFEGGLSAPEAPRLLMEIREDYAPRRRSWQDKVVANALATYEQTLAGLAAWQNEPDMER